MKPPQATGTTVINWVAPPRSRRWAIGYCESAIRSTR